MRDFWKPMPVSGKLIRELLLLFLLLWVQQSYAQRITRQYNNVSFSAALKDLNARQHKYTINFVYDELEDFRVICVGYITTSNTYNIGKIGTITLMEATMNL